MDAVAMRSGTGPSLWIAAILVALASSLGMAGTASAQCSPGQQAFRTIGGWWCYP